MACMSSPPPMYFILRPYFLVLVPVKACVVRRCDCTISHASYCTNALSAPCQRACFVGAACCAVGWHHTAVSNDDACPSVSACSCIMQPAFHTYLHQLPTHQQHAQTNSWLGVTLSCVQRDSVGCISASQLLRAASAAGDCLSRGLNLDLRVLRGVDVCETCASNVSVVCCKSRTSISSSHLITWSVLLLGV
jgi:hypothetical protein